MCNTGGVDRRLLDDKSSSVIEELFVCKKNIEIELLVMVREMHLFKGTLKSDSSSEL